MTYKYIFFLILSLGFYFQNNSINLNNFEKEKCVGMFKPSDKKLQGIKYGNWGSRPYEYEWARIIVSVTGKKVIDLGVGLPSQYNWYEYVLNNLNPSFYAGIDLDERIKKEELFGKNYEIKLMNMAQLEYPDNYFDVAYCISTFEHIEYDTFIKTIQEAYRVLKDDGLLIITLDEEWDKDQSTTHANGWNTLEQSLIKKGLFKRGQRSFGLPEFLLLIQEYFRSVLDDIIIDTTSQTIRSINNDFIYYSRPDKDPKIIHSDIRINSCVSYALLKKVPHNC